MKRLAVFTYHYLTDPDKPLQRRILGPSRRAFEEQVDFLCREYIPLRPDKLASFFGVSDDGDEIYFLLTFDDGLREHADFAGPLLADRGLSGLFFIPSCVLEGFPIPPPVLHYSLAVLRISRTVELVNHALAQEGISKRFDLDPERTTQENITLLKQFFNGGLDHVTAYKIACSLFELGLKREIPDAMDKIFLNRGDIVSLLAAGHVVGGHTCTHPFLGCSLSSYLAEKEVVGAVQALARVARAEIVHFAYPFGLGEDYLTCGAQVLSKAGISFGFTTVRTLNLPGTNPLRISRYSVYGSDTPDSLARFIHESSLEGVQ